jgi:cystathionine gamma-lyase
MSHEATYGFATKAIHAGQKPDPNSGALVQPISLSSTFQQKSPGELYPGGFEYSRSGNPTRKAYEANVAACEGAQYGLAFASGSAATATICSLFSQGDHIVSIDDVYGGTQRYFNNVASRFGVTFTFADMTKEGALQAAITPQTKLVWIETPTNPTLKIVDIEEVARIAHENKCILVVDNTFMSPFFQNPLKHGADMVVHSVSKYINGHTDVIGGFVALNDRALYDRLKYLQNAVGCIPSPFDCYLAMRGMKTLHLRMQAHEKNAFQVARFLETHPKVTKLFYPGLESHPQHAIAKKQNSGFGGMITFFLVGGLAQSRQFLETLTLCKLAESLGAVETLIEHPAIMTHASVPAEVRAKLGISDSLVRLSVGVEDVADIIADLTRGLDAITLP